MTRDQAIAMAGLLAAEFERRVVQEGVPRIRHCVSLLTEAQVWQRPNSHCNSIANLLLHLAGNVRQWIVAGLGGDADARDRPREFAADAGASQPSPPELLDALDATVRQASAIIARLTPEQLLATYPFQGGRFPDTGLGCVVHVTEHFSGHAYQIYAWTKQLTASDLRFYDL